jgi:hypothetical protein
MTNLGSTHFSEQLSYKILFVSSYGSKDMNLTSLEHLQEFFRKLRNWWDFSHRERYQPGSLTNWAGWPDWALELNGYLFRLTAGGHLSESDKSQKKVGFVPGWGFDLKICFNGAKSSDRCSTQVDTIT